MPRQNRVSMPPGPHSLARLRIWSGAKNQAGLAPGSSGSSGDELRCVSPMRPEYFICVAEMAVQPCAQLAVARHVDEGGRRIGWQRGHPVVGHDLVVAAERSRQSRHWPPRSVRSPGCPCARCAGDARGRTRSCWRRWTASRCARRRNRSRPGSRRPETTA